MQRRRLARERDDGNDRLREEPRQHLDQRRVDAAVAVRNRRGERAQQRRVAALSGAQQDRELLRIVGAVGGGGLRERVADRGDSRGSLPGTFGGLRPASAPLVLYATAMLA